MGAQKSSGVSARLVAGSLWTQTFMAVVLPGLLGVKGFRFYVSRRHELICPIGRTM